MAQKKPYTLDDVRREAADYKEQQAPTELIQLVVFKLGGERYALPIDQVKEVVYTPQVARMPQTPPFIKGLSSIRGNLIALMDLEQKFGLHSGPITDGVFPYTLVIENPTYKVGVLVKEVPHTVTVPVEDIEHASDFVQYSSLDARCLLGVVTVKEHLVILIDIMKMVEVEGIKTEY